MPMNMGIHVFATVSFYATHLHVAVDIGTAFLGLAALLDKYLLGVLTVALMVEGFMYMTVLDDPQKLMHVKRAIGATVIGAIIVIAASTLAPELVAAFNR